jgi:YegS/Rv2252/BmrU family lipid kinase
LATDSVFAVVNPEAGNGRTRKAWKQLQGPLEERLGKIDWRQTERPGHGTELALRALDGGYEFIVSVGGDGTHHEVTNAFVGTAGSQYPHAVFAPLSMGTGSDLAKTLRIPRNPESAIEIIARKRVVAFDAGMVRYWDLGGQNRERAFINIASFGISGQVDIRVNRTSKALGGFFSFLWASLATLLTYRAQPLRYSLDGGPWQECRSVLAVAANGQYFGGGMWVAPSADPSDGLFYILVAREMSLVSLLILFAKLYRGTHIGHSKVEIYQARSLKAESSDQVWLDVDGEPLGTLPCSFEIVPKALNVVVGPEFRSSEHN